MTNQISDFISIQTNSSYQNQRRIHLYFINRHLSPKQLFYLSSYKKRPQRNQSIASATLPLRRCSQGGGRHSKEGQERRTCQGTAPEVEDRTQFLLNKCYSFPLDCKKKVIGKLKCRIIYILL